MTNLEYYIKHVFPTGWQSIRSAFRIWADLMGSNYKDYNILHEDNPEQECIEWFWVSLGEDNIFEKEFLEYLYELCERIDRGEEKLTEWKGDNLDELLQLYDIEVID
jgi:hypothetical protein